MLHGHNMIGFADSASGKQTCQSFSTIKGAVLAGDFIKATEKEMVMALDKTEAAFSGAGGNMVSA